MHVEIGLIELGLRLLQGGARAFELRLEGLDPKLSRDQRGPGPGCIGLLRLQVRTRLLLTLNGAGALFDQILGALLLLLREFQLRFGLIDLRLGLIDLLALTVDLRLHVSDIGPRHLDLCLGLIDRDLVVAIVDLGEQIAGFDMLVVGDRNVGDVASDLRGHRKAARGNERIVRGFEIPDLEPIGDPADRCDQQQADGGRRKHPMLAQLRGKRAPRPGICITRSLVGSTFALLRATLRQPRFLGRRPAPIGFSIQLRDLEFDERHRRPQIDC